MPQKGHEKLGRGTEGFTGSKPGAHMAMCRVRLEGCRYSFRHPAQEKVRAADGLELLSASGRRRQLSRMWRTHPDLVRMTLSHILQMYTPLGGAEGAAGLPESTSGVEAELGSEVDDMARPGIRHPRCGGL